jgi:uncharacterized protein (DUF983 family)
MPEKKKRSYLFAAFACRCPRCRQGKLFTNPVSISLKKNMAMHRVCSVCGQPTEKEPGFYYGTGYVSYALAVAISISTFIAWFVLIGMSVSDNRFFYWLISNAILLVVIQPWMMRLSRSIWLSWFVKYDPDWKTHPVSREDVERIIPEQQMN